MRGRTLTLAGAPLQETCACPQVGNATQPTGGVSKGQGRNQHGLMTHACWEFLTQVGVWSLLATDAKQRERDTERLRDREGRRGRRRDEGGVADPGRKRRKNAKGRDTSAEPDLPLTARGPVSTRKGRREGGPAPATKKEREGEGRRGGKKRRQKRKPVTRKLLPFSPTPYKKPYKASKHSNPKQRLHQTTELVTKKPPRNAP